MGHRAGELQESPREPEMSKIFKKLHSPAEAQKLSKKLFCKFFSFLLPKYVLCANFIQNYQKTAILSPFPFLAIL
jgi:hypothetical protein